MARGKSPTAILWHQCARAVHCLRAVRKGKQRGSLEGANMTVAVWSPFLIAEVCVPTSVKIKQSHYRPG